VVWPYACSASAGVHYFSMGFSSRNRALWCLFVGDGFWLCLWDMKTRAGVNIFIKERCEYYIA